MIQLRCGDRLFFLRSVIRTAFTIVHIQHIIIIVAHLINIIDDRLMFANLLYYFKHYNYTNILTIHMCILHEKQIIDTKFNLILFVLFISL